MVQPATSESCRRSHQLVEALNRQHLRVRPQFPAKGCLRHYLSLPTSKVHLQFPTNVCHRHCLSLPTSEVHLHIPANGCHHHCLNLPTSERQRSVKADYVSHHRQHSVRRRSRQVSADLRHLCRRFRTEMFQSNSHRHQFQRQLPPRPGDQERQQV